MYDVGHVVTMAKDRWGSVVLAAALSHVDDTVLLRKCILPELQVSTSTAKQPHTGPAYDLESLNSL